MSRTLEDRPPGGDHSQVCALEADLGSPIPESPMNAPPDLEATRGFLEILHPRDGRFSLCGFPPGDLSAPNWGGVFSNPEEAISAIRERVGENQLFVSAGRLTHDPGTIKFGKPSKHQIRELPALWVDIDAKSFSGHSPDLAFEEARQHLRSLWKAPPDNCPLPNLVVMSGGGFHLWWMLAAAVEITNEADRKLASDLLRGLAQLWRGDMSSAEISRIMRLPGTLNLKPDRGGAQVRILRDDSSTRRSTLDQLLPLRIDALDRQPSKQLPQHGAAGNGDSHSPGGELKLTDGARNTTLTSLAGTMRRRGMNEAAIAAALLQVNKDQCKQPLDEVEVRGIAASVARYAPHAVPRDGDSVGAGEIANAESLAEATDKALQSAQSGEGDPIDAALALIPAEIGVTQLPKALEPILRTLATLDPATGEAYLTGPIKSRFRLTNNDLKGYRSTVRGYRGEIAQERASSKKQSPGNPLWNDVELLNPAQDFVADEVYFCVYLSVERKGPRKETRVQREPYLVTSSRELVPLDSETLRKRGLRIANEDQLPSDPARWSTSPETPNSVHAFLNENDEVDALSLVDEIEGLYRTYLEYPLDDYYPLLALWTIGTYAFMSFESYPYLFLTGTKRAGKTRTIEVADPLCFNSMSSASMSDATMFRSVSADRCTILHDEAAKFRGKHAQDLSERLEIFNSGYKRSGAVYRCVGDNHTPVRFSTYGPKLLANIEGLDPTTADRTITLRLLRAQREIPRFSRRTLDPTFSRLRNALYVFVLRHHREIGDIYQTQEPVTGLRDRDEEIWSPIFALAEFFDCKRLEGDPGIPEGDLLLAKMLRLARLCRDDREEGEREENVDQRILAAIMSYVDEKPPIEDQDGREIGCYVAEELRKHVTAGEGLEWVKANFLTRSMKRLRLLGDGKGKTQRLRVSSDHRRLDPSCKQVGCYRLNVASIQDVARRYGVDAVQLSVEGSEMLHGDDAPF